MNSIIEPQIETDCLESKYHDWWDELETILIEEDIDHNLSNSVIDLVVLKTTNKVYIEVLKQNVDIYPELCQEQKKDIHKYCNLLFNDLQGEKQTELGINDFFHTYMDLI